VAAQLVASRVVPSSTELVSYIVMFPHTFATSYLVASIRSVNIFRGFP
jgi:hypothetical protein